MFMFQAQALGLHVVRLNITNSSLLESFQSSVSGGLSSIGLSTSPAKQKDADCFGLSTVQRYIGWMMMIAASILFLMISFFTLPMVVIMPAKFAMSFSFGRSFLSLHLYLFITSSLIQ